MSTATKPREPGLWGDFLDLMGGTVLNTANEIHRLMPDSILFGSILMYFLTQNMSFGIFAIFMLEIVLSHKLISWVSTQALGPSRPLDIKCRSGYKTPQFSPQRMFLHDPYPSYGLFSVTSIATYLSLATKEFSNTMDAMGDEWSSRAKLAYGFSAVIVAIFLIYRVRNCDSVGEAVAAIAMAIITAAIFFYINRAVFGPESMNFLGLPYLVTKESQGSPIYICSADTQDTA